MTYCWVSHGDRPLPLPSLSGNGSPRNRAQDLRRYSPSRRTSSRRLAGSYPRVDDQHGGRCLQSARPGRDTGAQLARSAKRDQRSSKLLLQRLRRTEGAMQRRRVSNRPDLFPVNLPEVRRVAIERVKLLLLLRTLLFEVVFGANPERPSTESDHE